MSNEKRSPNSPYKFLRVLESGGASDIKNSFVSLRNLDINKSPAGSIVYARVSPDGKKGEIERMPSHIPEAKDASDINKLLLESRKQLDESYSQLKKNEDKLNVEKEELQDIRSEVEAKIIDRDKLIETTEKEEAKKIKASNELWELEEKLDRYKDLQKNVAKLECQKQEAETELKRLRGIVWKNATESEPYTQTLECLELYGDKDETHATKKALASLKESGYSVNDLDLVALHTSLKTAPFTVLTGPSGTGKTSLLRCYAEALGINLTTVAVQPNWHSAADLHGYVNPLNDAFRGTAFSQALERQTEFSDTDDNSGFLDLVLLDEINLSRVEYFLADYLSALEYGGNVELIASELATGKSIPEWLKKRQGRVAVPKTLLIAGTANEDHTTQTFSDKFRDRSAFLGITVRSSISFDLTTSEKKRVTPSKRVSVKAWRSWCKDIDDITGLNNHQKSIETLLEQSQIAISARSALGVWRFFTHAYRLLDKLGTKDAADHALDLALETRFIQKYAALWRVQAPEKSKTSADALKDVLKKSDYKLDRSLELLESI